MATLGPLKITVPVTVTFDVETRDEAAEGAGVGSIVGYLRLDRADWDAQLAKATPTPSDGIKVREVDGGVVLDVPSDVRKQLIEFGWMPPVDGA